MDELGLIQRLRRSTRARAVAVGLSVVVMAGVSSVLTQDLFRLRDSPPSESTLFAVHLALWSIWAIGLTAVLTLRGRLLKRWPLKLVPRVLLDLALMFGYSAAIAPTGRWLMGATIGLPEFPPGMHRNFGPAMLMRGAVVYVVVLSTLTSLRNYMHRRDRDEEVRERALREQQLSAQLATARLETLRSQLSPHFLFNSLHAIGAMVVDGESTAAHRAITALADLLRHSFRHEDGPTISVEEETELVREYLSLEQIRLGDRLETCVEVAPDALGHQVPALMLMPIVENAVRHGIAPRPSGGTVTVRVERVPDSIELTVQDDGVGVSASKQRRADDGIGLANCAERLQAMYGDAGSMSIERLASGGTKVAIRVPEVVA